MLEHVLLELALLFALCVGVATSFHRLRLPPIVGFLCAGVLVGPHGIGLVHHEETVRELAEVGVVVLLFAAGLEVPLGQLARLRRTILLGGSIQVLGAVAIGTGLSLLTGSSWAEALFLGCLLSLSSTAASTKMLVDHGEFSAPHGRFVLGINIAQDLAVVPMILVVPMLGGSAGGGPGVIGAAIGIGILGGVLLGVRFLLPHVVRRVCATRSRELFVLLLAMLCLGMAAITARLGMSLALGAFFAGILLADSDHHSLAASEVEPFRDAFASLFFVSIGMLFDYRTIATMPLLVIAMLLLVLVGKAGLVWLAARVLGQPFWVCLRAGSALAQVGEFSFVLVQAGRQGNVLPGSVEQLFVVVAVLSIASTPIFYGLVQTLASRTSTKGRVNRTGLGRQLDGHAVIVGYGPTGRAVCQGLRALGIPVVISELNAATVRAEKAQGIPIVFGDATRASVLRALGIERAHLLVLAVNDSKATQRIAQLARQLAPNVHVIVRTSYIADTEVLRRAGAHEVVPQELEASVEILVRVLRRYLVADDEIGRRVREARTVHGGSDRLAEVSPTGAERIAEFVPGIGFRVLRVEAGAPVAGRSLAEIGVRRRTGCSVVAVRRGTTNLTVVTPETVLLEGDTVVVLGPESRLGDAGAMFVAATTSVESS
ncbi:MAG: cation:proton antiporter [Planctomycetes bacterium]|nr:cation:proton antiporter [Planctomycetota bacterium]